MDFIGSWAKDVGEHRHLHRKLHDGDEGTACRPNRLHIRHSTWLQQQRLQATLSNNTGFLFAAKYKVQALTVFGGYGWYKQANPSDDYLNGFKTIGGWNVPATINRRSARKSFSTAWTNFTNFNVPRIAPYFWVGAKYAITPQIDVTGAYYYQQQTDFNTSACTTETVHLRRAEWKQTGR